MEKTPQIRHWCFTWYDDAWPNWIPDKMVYLVYQVEVCPDTNNFHIQGYVEFKRSQRLGSVKKLLRSNTVHLEPRQGSRAQARAYCMKEESRSTGDYAGPFEYGEWVEGEVKRSDLADAVESIKSGKTWSEFLELHTCVAVRYLKSLRQIWDHFNVKPRDGSQPVFNVFLYGDSRVGKTRFSHWLRMRCETSPYTGYIGRWWEAYMGQEWALYDDFDGQPHMDVGLFKKICDRYPLRVEYKGGSVEYCATVNIFTSNTCPIDWYSREHWDAVRLRANHLVWWRRDSVRCESCASQDDCDLLKLIAEFQEEVALLDELEL